MAKIFTGGKTETIATQEWVNSQNFGGGGTSRDDCDCKPKVTHSELEDALAALDERLATITGKGIPEAPSDGKQYGRQNKQWTEVENTGGGNALPDGTSGNVVVSTTDGMERSDVKLDGTIGIAETIDMENPSHDRIPDEVAVATMGKELLDEAVELLGDTTLGLPDDLEMDAPIEIIEEADINSSFDPTDDQVFTSAGVKKYLMQLGLINA